MTSQDIRQQAEALARKLKVGRTCQPPATKETGWPDFYADVPWNEGLQAILEFADKLLAEARASHAAAPEPGATRGDEMRLWCYGCGQSVSTPVPKGTIVRAWIQCPECIKRFEADFPAPARREEG